jgi:hypothetical protein
VRARFWAGFAASWAALLALAAYVNRQPAGTYTSGQHAARVVPAFTAPAAAWLAHRALGALQAALDRRSAARARQLEAKLRKQVRAGVFREGQGGRKGWHGSVTCVPAARSHAHPQSSAPSSLALPPAHLPTCPFCPAQVCELKDSTRYERTLTLLQKYDPGGGVGAGEW